MILLLTLLQVQSVSIFTINEMARLLTRIILAFLLALLGVVVLYTGWYFWLAIQPPSWQYNEQASTTHYANRFTKEFVPDKIEKPCCLFKVSSEHPTIGGHYINLLRWFSPFDPNKPAGIITWNGKTVGYFWSGTEEDFKKYPYHWHLHKNMCVTSGADTTTDLDFWACLKHGYLPATPLMRRYMIHYWLIPNPYGVNEMYNSNLK